jgi:Transglutaminase-like superfamily
MTTGTVMPEYCLSPHVHFCRTEDGLVLLDLKRARYLGIPAEQQRLLRSAVRDWREVNDTAGDSGQPPAEQAAELLESFVQSGLLTADPTHGASVRQAACKPGTQAIPFAETVRSDMRAAHFFRLTRAWLTTIYKLRRRSLESIVHAVRHRKERHSGTTSPGDAATIRALSALFCHLRPLVFTAKDQCLLDSLILVEFLAGYGKYPTWVFGVKTQPFAAHSWVQHGDLVLNDSVEHVRAYVPILSV